MDHESCVAAIQALRVNASTANVTSDHGACLCDTERVAACDWVGNGIRYACLHAPADSSIPRRVYNGTNATKGARLSKW